MFESQRDTDLLVYNCFGMAIIHPHKIIVSVNGYKYGRGLERMLKHELKTEEVKLDRADHPVLLPFGAYVTEDDIYLAPGRMEDYDAEMYVINKEIIEKIIKSAIGVLRGGLLKRD
jgi:hypothetical protein